MGKIIGNKKGVGLNDLVPIGLTFVVLAIVLAMGAKVVSNVGDTLTVNTTAHNATVFGQQGLQTLSQWMPTIAIIVAAAVIIGILLSAFVVMKGGQ